MKPTETEVQFFLDQLEPMERFHVIFTKTDGTQRQMIGMLDPDNPKRSNPVPVMTPDGWRSFRLESVLHIQKESD